VDSLPAQTTRALQLIGSPTSFATKPNQTTFAAIANCGYAEAGNNRVALMICQRFAKETAMEWMGGLGAWNGRNDRWWALAAERTASFVTSSRRWTCALSRLAQGLPIPESRWN